MLRIIVEAGFVLFQCAGFIVVKVTNKYKSSSKLFFEVRHNIFIG
jgi:hypothetical protein